MTEVKVDFTEFQKLIEDIFGMKTEAKKTEQKETDNQYNGAVEEIFNFVNNCQSNCKKDHTSENCCKDQPQDQPQEKPRERSKELKIEQAIENSVLTNLEKLELLKSDLDNYKSENKVPEIDIIISGFFYKIEEFCDLLFCLLDTGDGIDYIERISIFLREEQKFSAYRSTIKVEKDRLRRSSDIYHQIFLNLFIQYVDTLEIIYNNIKSDLLGELLNA